MFKYYLGSLLLLTCPVKSLKSLKGLHLTCLRGNHALLSIYHTDYDNLDKIYFCNVFWFYLCEKTQKYKAYQEVTFIIFILICIVEGISSDSARTVFLMTSPFCRQKYPKGCTREKWCHVCTEPSSFTVSEMLWWTDSKVNQCPWDMYIEIIRIFIQWIYDLKSQCHSSFFSLSQIYHPIWLFKWCLMYLGLSCMYYDRS